jgi:hypothetical protein
MRLEQRARLKFLCLRACLPTHHPSTHTHVLQVNDLLGNSPASTVAGSAEAQQAPVVLEGSTGADLAASQAAQQRQAGS